MTNATIAYWKMNLPTPSQAGNLLAVSCTYKAGSGAILVVDDKSNSWTTGVTVNDGGNGQSIGIAYAPNVAPGTQLITVTFPSSSSNNSCRAFEFYNVATSNPVDGSGGQVTSGTSLATGSFSTATSGDLILFVAECDNCGTPSAPLSWTAGSGFSLLDADDTSFIADQYQIRSGTGSFNPAITLSHSAASAMAAAIAFKPASAGSGPAAGIRVNSLQVLNYPELLSGTASTMTFQFPSTGNLIVIQCTSVTTQKITGITSSPSNTWSHSVTSVDGSGGYSVDTWYAANASASTALTLTIKYGGTPIFGALQIYDVSGAAASPFDTYANATGNLAATTGTVNGPSITPSTSNGLVVLSSQQDGETVSSVSPGYTYTVQTDGQYQYLSLDQDGGIGAYYNPDTSQINFKMTYINTESGTIVGNWQAQAVAFKASGAAGQP
jgi:hypothetical protein